MKEDELKKIISDTIINNLDPDSFSRTVHNSTVDLIKVFNDFASQDKWISVEERLPERNKLVLIETRFCKYKQATALHNGVSWVCKDEEIEISNTRFWQELPKSPNT